MRELTILVMSLVQFVCYYTGRVLLPIASFDKLDVRPDDPDRVGGIVAMMFGAVVWSAIAAPAILIYKHWF